MNIVDPVPVDPLAGLEGGEATPIKGRGARTKHPSAYTCRILTSKGSTTGVKPKSEAQAQGSPDWLHWESAMAKEVSELTAKHTWELVDAPPGVHIVGSRWTYLLKHDANGDIICYKARLVAQGFT